MFTRDYDNYTQFTDNVFAISTIAKQDTDKDKINATIGSLSDENGSIVALKTVFDNERNIPDAKRAAYAPGLCGDPAYLKAVTDYVLDGRVKELKSEIIATPGGTGALSLAASSCLNSGETIIFPEVSWGNYKNIADESNLKRITYDIYNLNDLFAKIDSVDDKFILIVNSPCENPCGHKYTNEEWIQIIDKLNSLNREVILLADIAYIDFDYDDGRKCFECFDKAWDNVLVLIAFSASKSFSYYGERVGALLMLHRNEELLADILNHFTKHSRATWSNVNASAMINIAEIIGNHLDEYKSEVNTYIELLKTRSERLIEKLNENNIEYYPYNSGFFITLKTPDIEGRDALHKKLMEKHIYTIKVNNGIRIAICSLQLDKIDRLVENLK